MVKQVILHITHSLNIDYYNMIGLYSCYKAQNNYMVISRDILQYNRTKMILLNVSYITTHINLTTPYITTRAISMVQAILL